VVIEDKAYSVAVHYRHAARKLFARRAIHRAVRELRDSRRIGGKLAVNIVPVGAPDKGAALERARLTLACECAIYVGDDETDEDAFAAAPPHRLLSIRVGRIAAARSSARFYLESQRQIDALLDALVTFRRIAPARGSRQLAAAARARPRRSSAARTRTA
jgi:trehalose 6-phosphate phosphatase